MVRIKKVQDNKAPDINNSSIDARSVIIINVSMIDQNLEIQGKSIMRVQGIMLIDSDRIVHQKENGNIVVQGKMIWITSIDGGKCKTLMTISTLNAYNSITKRIINNMSLLIMK